MELAIEFEKYINYQPSAVFEILVMLPIHEAMNYFYVEFDYDPYTLIEGLIARVIEDVTEHGETFDGCDYQFLCNLFCEGWLSVDQRDHLAHQLCIWLADQEDAEIRGEFWFGSMSALNASMRFFALPPVSTEDGGQSTWLCPICL